MTFLDNTPDRNDPTRQCTCGYRRFRSRLLKAETSVQRWVLFDDGEFGGMGSMPFGTLFAMGGLGGWGLFTGTLRTVTEQVVCENCTRTRSSKLKSSFAFFGQLFFTDVVCISVSDLDAGIGTLELRFDGPGPVENVPFVRTSPTIPIDLANPGGEVFVSPPGPSAVTLCATLPPVVVEGLYTAVLLDRRSGYENTLGTVTLENDVIVLNPQDAELNGAPTVWVTKNLRSKQEVVQIASGTLNAIPFDYCEQVIEYDARFGTDPAAQGFTLTGTLPSTLLPGGALQMTSGGAAAVGVWKQDLTMVSTVDRINMYAVTQHRSNVDADAVGAGMNFLGAYADGSSTPFKGARWRYYDEMTMSLLDGTIDTSLVAPPAGKDLEQWRCEAIQGNDDNNVALVHPYGGPIEQHLMNLVFGTIAGPAPADPVMRAEFGDMAGTGINTLLRNYVVSGPGRFIRAWFRAFATVTEPVVRLNLVSDQVAGPTTARFKIRYGVRDQGDDPYLIPTASQSLTVDFSTPNQLLEAAFTITGLTAGQSFWFTVERDHTHVDDLTTATVFLANTTVRAL